MQINGGIRNTQNGLQTSIKAMHVATTMIAMSNENVGGFDKVGYQRKEPVVSRFTEYLGVHGLSQTVDDQVGRIIMSDNPLDCTIATKGYFQIQGVDGIELTRDGRFKLDKDGYLLNAEDRPVLSNVGDVIQLPLVPDSESDVVINRSGDVCVLNKSTLSLEKAGTIGVVDSDGMLVMSPEVKQGYNEFSNVSLQNEFLAMIPVVRNFDANRQLYMLQNEVLGSVISYLGSAS
ncbi:MAG: flagellar basal body rod C-terminal domain-containing protein [Candidatus Gastranaerophilales bacterium]